jgi:thiol-disulfide isomerase/thioredoxin
MLAKIHSQSGYTGPHFKGFDAAKVPDFYKPFSDGSILCAPGIFRFPDAHQLVSYIARLQWALLPAAEKEQVPVGAKLGYQLAQLCSPEAKSCLLNWDMRVTEPTNWREVRLNLLPNKALLTTNDMKREYDRVVNTLAIDTNFIGKPILDASFPDTSGRMVRFSDFRGKVVLVDVWATWCAPCKEQLPHLMKLEEEYRNNPDVVFVSLSVDREKDHAKWKKFIATEKLQGVQLIDFSGKIFQRPYAIEGIPRFILIDRAGNIAETRSPYPASGKELKSYLEELLTTGAE